MDKKPDFNKFIRRNKATLKKIAQLLQGYKGELSHKLNSKPERLSKNLKIIPASVHKIDILQMSPNAVEVCLRLQENGFDACIVGGSVRDAILGKKPKDFDIATSAVPRKICSIFGYRSTRIIGNRFKIVHLVFGGELIEITTFRDRQGTDSPRPRSNSRSIIRDNDFSLYQSDDASRRDFTINAFYYDPRTQNVFDYYEGWKDINNRRLKVIGDLKTRFIEDPVRILRAIRLSQKLGLNISKKTLLEMRKSSHLLTDIPPARINDELQKLLLSGNSLGCFNAINDLGIKKDTLKMLNIYRFESEPDQASVNFIHKTFEYFDKDHQENQKPDAKLFIAASIWRYYERYRTLMKVEELENKIRDILSSSLVPSSTIDTVILILKCQKQLANPSKTSMSLPDKDFFSSAHHLLGLRSMADEIPNDLVNWWKSLKQLSLEARKLALDKHRSPNRK